MKFLHVFAVLFFVMPAYAREATIFSVNQRGYEVIGNGSGTVSVLTPPLQAAQWGSGYKVAAEAPTPPPSISIPTEKPKGLTIGQVLQINGGLAGMNCAQRVLKDAGNEKMGCAPYEWSPGMAWRISDNAHKTEDVIRRYYKWRNETTAALPRDKDGKVPGDADAKFAVKDSEMLDTDTGVVLEHFKRSDLEPMKLPPSVLDALWAIIDQ